MHRFRASVNARTICGVRKFKGMKESIIRLHPFKCLIERIRSEMGFAEEMRTSAVMILHHHACGYVEDVMNGA